jgi:hypothetical protein
VEKRSGAAIRVEYLVPRASQVRSSPTAGNSG